MNRFFAVSFISYWVGGCATPESNQAVAEAATPQKQCEDAVTGSHVKRCDRGNVKVITREELERNPFPIGLPSTSAGGPAN